MFSSKSFRVSGLAFRSLIHFEFVFVYSIRKCSNFILLHIAVQFSQHHLFKNLSFPHCLSTFAGRFFTTALCGKPKTRTKVEQIENKWCYWSGHSFSGTQKLWVRLKCLQRRGMRIHTHTHTHTHTQRQNKPSWEKRNIK